MAFLNKKNCLLAISSLLLIITSCSSPSEKTITKRSAQIPEKLKTIPQLNTTTALKILTLCQAESAKRNANVAIIVLGTDGRILASCKSEEIGPQIYDFATFKAQTSWFKGLSTEEIESRSGVVPEIFNVGRLKMIRGIKGGIPIYYQGFKVGAIGVSGTLAAIDKEIAIAGLGTQFSTKE